MVIKTKEQAQAAIDAIVEWLNRTSIKKNEGCYPDGIHTEDVREWCYELLEASLAEGLGGCLLCQG